jgi:hypothetical protein
VDLAAALQPRYVEAPAKAGLYESLYLTAHHPTEPRALWVRHTVSKPPGTAPRASLWCTWFDSNGVRAAKVTTTEASSTAERPLQVGDHGWIGAGGAAGAVDLPSLVARWDLRFCDPEAPMLHLPKPWLYTAPVPRTKSLSAAPMLRLEGSLTVDGHDIDVDRWPCSIGHNWGAEHADRWIWVHADGEAEDGPVWLDAIVGQIRVGPATTPWIANGAISIGGVRHRLGGLRLGAGTPVAVHDRGATVTLRGRDVTVQLDAELDLARCVAWTYADPAGNTREVVNSSVAPTVLRIRPARSALVHVTAPVSAFEIGGRHRAFDVPLQPFPD